MTALLAACGVGDPEVVTEPLGTIGGVGSLPDELQLPPVDAVPAGTIVPRVTVERDEDLGPIGTRVTGPRLLVIGDSIFASMSRRYGGELCDTLVPLGWEVEVNAEVGRFVDFAARVLDRRLRPGAGTDWDAAVITLGSNYRGDAGAFRVQLMRALDRLEPRPVALVTVSEFRPDRAAVNEVLREMPEYYAEVRVVDWAALTASEPALLAGDRLHLSDTGRARLAEELAAVLDVAPGDADGACLSTEFTDDSAIDAAGPVVPPTTVARAGSGSSSGGGSGASATTTTVTTRPPTSVGTGTGSEGGGGTDGGSDPDGEDGSGGGDGGVVSTTEPSGSGGSTSTTTPGTTQPATTVATTPPATTAPPTTVSSSNADGQVSTDDAEPGG